MFGFYFFFSTVWAFLRLRFWSSNGVSHRLWRSRYHNTTEQPLPATEDDNPSDTIFFNPENKIDILKLTYDTFLLWKFHVLTTLEGYEMEDYLDVDLTPPAKTITVQNVEQPNPNSKLWRKQDRVISSWLLGSMSENILNQMLHCTTAHEIWNSSSNFFQLEVWLRL